MAVTLVNKFQGHPGKGDDVIAWLSPASKGFTNTPGCNSATILRDADNPDVIISIEEWDSKEAHQAFQQSMDPKGMAEVMKTLAGQPEGTYYETI